MTPMALWQKIVYGLGEGLLVAGLLWGLYDRFMKHACPTGAFNELTLIVIGLAVAVLPLHPFRREQGTGAPGSGAGPGAAKTGGTAAAATQNAGRMPAPPYLTPALRRSPALALSVWIIALLGAAFSLWSRLSMQPGIWWFAGLLPAGLYFWFGISTSKSVQAQRPAPPSKKPAPPKDRGGHDA